ncbi:hypothetical protein V8G54_030265 [Vigna mungo]|uniref:Uncharacterized protein n=1 Tax=Vigna mungo TaxID=3915 RepID=A0AAQ3MWQ4_VIGMU
MTYLGCRCLILRHDFPKWCFGEELKDEKLFCLLTLVVVLVLYFSRERDKSWRPFHDKLLLDTSEESTLEPDISSDPCCLPFEFIGPSSSFEQSLLILESKGFSRSEPESNSSDTPLIP